MKIVDLQVIPFRVPRIPFHAGEFHPGTTVTQTLTKVVTDEGAEGYYLGGAGHGDQDGLSPEQRGALEGRIKNMVVGHDPFDREKFWHWMWVANVDENILSVLDLVLWDLQARAFGVPVHKLLGGCRERVLAYGSTYPNMGSPDEYGAHALDCKRQGYTHYKIHPYYFWDPVTQQPDRGRPSHIEQDIEACQAVRDAVGPDMTLSYDPWGTYRTYEDAVRVGRELERLDFYWYEHPMSEYRVAAYEKLCRELDIPILSPEIAAGSLYTRADWIRREASDMSRIDVLRGGITGVKKLTGLCEAYGVRCEIHMSGFANLQVLGSTSEDTCQYYERGLLAPGVDYETPPPYLHEICDPMDDEGYVRVPTEPGMGYSINWDYIEEHRI
ncbi:enolase [Candidatus Poribacteria bacterium]|jgi:L-alanine-DL-glutamate epimerase-like enolase superfamily enzyme|nr:enolase [Candidatus Poribacteria bacterium]MBT5533882.1 enolase [Candidatus Poribacteria bacterium]MBT5712848.1 enolase [Candidatus Poribacteria bacterium]MBT7809638.1 enolase [Candidatus Poribacteria bacterium]